MTAKQYQEIIDCYIKEYDIKVIRYYKNFHGSAYIPGKRIKIPRPTTELTFYLALHEIGHIACGVAYSHQNWKHEYGATKWALDEAKKNKIEFSKEVKQSIKGYLRYSIKLSVCSGTSIDSIPSKVFKLAGLNKSYWRKQLLVSKIPTTPQEVENFYEWRNIRIKWK